MNANELAGRVAIVTGGASGIGAAITGEMVACGAKVAIVDQNNEMLKAITDRINAEQPDRVIGIHADIRDSSEIERAVNLVTQHWNRLDILVNNAGIFGGWLLDEIPLDGWNEVFSVNLTAPMLFSQLATPHMARNGYGSIINITSIASQQSEPRSVTYAATKGGLQSLTQALAVELATYGIRVNAVAPHAIITPLWEKLGSEEEVRAKFLPRIPAGRFGKPEEVAYIVAFLASERAGFVTGATYSVNGGITAMM